MILRKNGMKFEFEDKTFVIGGYVYGLAGSAYNGLVGTIKEIRTDDDKETDNPDPDIYVDFRLPLMQKDREELKKRFSALHGYPVDMDCINLDTVIMSPYHISLFSALKNSLLELPVFVLQEEWSDNILGETKIWIFSDRLDAQQLMNGKLTIENEIGLLTKWRNDKGFTVEESDDEYRCWLDNRYDEAHYCLRIIPQNAYLTPLAVDDICNERIKENRRDDFYEEICQWEETEALTAEQFQQLIALPNIAERIQERLLANTSYWNAYYQTLSEVSHEIVTEFVESLKQSSATSTE